MYWLILYLLNRTHANTYSLDADALSAPHPKKEGSSVSQNNNSTSRKGIKALFCLFLCALLALGVTFSTSAAEAEPVLRDVKIVVSSTHAAARTGNTLTMWGNNAHGQIPGASGASATTPVTVDLTIADVAVSEDRTLVVTEDGKLLAFGVDPASRRRLDGTLIAENAVSVACADSFAAYIDGDGALYTWGSNDSGQLGNNTTEDSTAFVKVLNGGVQKVVLSRDFALALMENGTLYGWGSNRHQELNQPVDQATVLSPVVVTEGVKDMAAGRYHSLILKSNGVLYACGGNTSVQLGADSTAEALPMTQILSGITSIASGDYHGLAVSSDDLVYAWGSNIFGQLGIQNIPVQSKPLAVPSLSFAQVFAGGNSSYGVTRDGDIFSFGENTSYVLAQNTGSDSAIPVRVFDAKMAWTFGQSFTYAGDILSVEEEKPVIEQVEESIIDGVNAGLRPADANVVEDQQPAGTHAVPSDTPTAEPSDEPAADAPVVTAFVNGYTDGTFLPNKAVTRAEFLKMLVAALDDGEPKVEGWGEEDLFTDVGLNSWYAPYVAQAKASGWLTGFSDGTFRPNDPITRADASIMVSRALQLDTEAAIPSKFHDVASTSYYAKYVDALTALGILQGDEWGNFNPLNNITRAEAVTLIARAVGFEPDEAAKAALIDAGEAPFSDVATTSWYFVYVLRGVGAAE